MAKSTTLSGLGTAKCLVPERLARFLLQETLGISLGPPAFVEKRVWATPFKDDAKAALCISLDWELNPNGKTDHILEATKSFLRVTNAFNVPVTLALCGNHALRLPEALELILQNGRHELASHTFDHIDLSQPSLSRAQVAEDLGKNSAVLKTIPRSMVFPWDSEGHFDVLRELGYISFRGGSRRLGYPKRREGMWDIARTYSLTAQEAIHHTGIPLKLLDLALHYGGLLHLWTHPWNMSPDGNVEKFMADVLRPLLSQATTRRDEGRLWIATMEQIANYCEAVRNTRILYHSADSSNVTFVAECRVESPIFDHPPEATLKALLPHPSSRVRVFFGEDLTHSFHATWTRYRDVAFTVKFEKPRVEIRIEAS